MTNKVIPEDAANKLEDLSGISLEPGENPYNALIKACDDKHEEICRLYAAHRINRNAQQKEKFLDPNFKELFVDQTLLRLERPEIDPGFQDARNCLVLWSRPPDHIIRLAQKLQTMLEKVAPGIWTMPPQRMHLTVLEIAFSKTPEEVDTLLNKIRPSMRSITSRTFTHRSRLVKPMISHDLSAFAVSFLPATGEAITSPPLESLPPKERIVDGDEYTYHHLRRDVYDSVQDAGVQVGSRYQVPSAHITLGRFLDQKDHETAEQRKAWVDAIDGMNAWLEREVWDKADGEYVGEWRVGQERGLDFRAGRLWYGGGRSITLGEGY